ncbi:hypothetical protein [Morganella morganii]|uniref:hypothetical protein n=1 Tax=Morganella morganii TaxID=582 RepID=UPI003EC88B9D
MEPLNNITVAGTLCFPSGEQCQTVNLTAAVPVPEPVSGIDFAVASQYWGLAFTSVIFLYLFSLGIGQILKLVKHA